MNEIDEEAEAHNKGRRLLALKEYPRFNLKRAFWNWYLTTTTKGSQLFQTAADNLVLYTHCNRTSVFYRLKNATFGKKAYFYVSPALRRKIVMMNMISC